MVSAAESAELHGFNQLIRQADKNPFARGRMIRAGVFWYKAFWKSEVSGYPTGIVESELKWNTNGRVTKWAALYKMMRTDFLYSTG